MFKMRKGDYMYESGDEFCGFFDGEFIGIDDDGYEMFDREYNSQEFSDFFQSFFGNGIYPDAKTNSLGNQLLVRASTDFNVTVSPGQALINGRNYRLKRTKRLKLTDSDISFNRIDNIVLRLDLDNRLIELDVVDGVAQTNPVAPQVTRNDRVYELVLAQVSVSANSLDISQADIRDTRHLESMCGIVATAVQDIDVSNLYLQYENSLREHLEDLSNILESENIAGELISLINAKADRILVDEENGNKFEMIVRGNRPYLRVVEVNE